MMLLPPVLHLVALFEMVHRRMDALIRPIHPEPKTQNSETKTQNREHETRTKRTELKPPKETNKRDNETTEGVDRVP